MKRRAFFRQSLAASALLGWSLPSCANKHEHPSDEISDYEALVSDLLLEWTNALLANQIDQVESPEIHGAIYCTACETDELVCTITVE